VDPVANPALLAIFCLHSTELVGHLIVSSNPNVPRKKSTSPFPKWASTLPNLAR